MAGPTSFYYGDENVENADKYKPGGYHPVLLGEVLPKRSTSSSRKPRYKIMQKLGHGAFATVWLARDLEGKFGYVALKVNVSSITGDNNEIKILRSLRNSKPEHEGYQNIIHLLDDFTIHGQNGTHDCLVTEVVIGMNDLKHNSLTFTPYIKEMSRQFMTGLAYLHEQGVTHGDLHLGNLGIELSHLNKRSEKTIMDFFRPDCVALVSEKLPDENPPFPPYLVNYISLAEHLECTTKSIASNGSVCLKIMDFGNSFREKEKRPSPNTPISIRSPEVTFCELSKGKICSDWGRPIDVWAAACTLYELNYGGTLFYGSKGDGIIYETLKLAGSLPPTWKRYWDIDEFCARRQKPSNIEPENSWAERGDALKRSNTESRESVDQFIDLLRKMLRIDPSERPRIRGLLAHPWFSNP